MKLVYILKDSYDDIFRVSQSGSLELIKSELKFVKSEFSLCKDRRTKDILKDREKGSSRLPDVLVNNVYFRREEGATLETNARA